MFPLSSWDSWENSVKYSVPSKGKCENGFSLTFRRCQIPATWPDPAVQPSCCSARTRSSPTGLRAAARLPGLCWPLRAGRPGPTESRVRERVAGASAPGAVQIWGVGGGRQEALGAVTHKRLSASDGQSSTATEAEFRRPGGGFFFLLRYKPQTECG